MAAAMVTVTNKFKIKSAKAINKLHSFFFVFLNFRHEDGYYNIEVKEKFWRQKTREKKCLDTFKQINIIIITIMAVIRILGSLQQTNSGPGPLIR